MEYELDTEQSITALVALVQYIRKYANLAKDFDFVYQNEYSEYTVDELQGAIETYMVLGGDLESLKAHMLI